MWWCEICVNFLVRCRAEWSGVHIPTSPVVVPGFGRDARISRVPTILYMIDVRLQVVMAREDLEE